MSIEQAVRERHAFEDRMRNFLTLASVMTNREIELALSRLADMFTHMGGAPHVHIRGQVLKQYFNLRLANQRQERFLKRILFKPLPGIPPYDQRIDQDQSSYLIRSAANYPLLLDGQIAAPAGAASQSFDETVFLLAP